MAATYITLFLSLAACQALLTVKLADWLSADETTGRGIADAVLAESLAA
jgi:hypothetical protein